MAIDVAWMSELFPSFYASVADRMFLKLATQQK